MGAAGGALNGIIMLGAFFPWANWQGAISGTVIAYGVMMWIGIGKYTVVGIKDYLPSPVTSCNMTTNLAVSSYNVSLMRTNPSVIISTSPAPHTDMSGLDQLYSLSYLWYSTLGMLITFVVGLIVSFITGPTKPEDVDKILLIPVFDRLCCCLPKNIRRYLHCGVEYKKEAYKETYQPVCDGPDQYNITDLNSIQDKTENCHVVDKSVMENTSL